MPFIVTLVFCFVTSLRCLFQNIRVVRTLRIRVDIKPSYNVYSLLSSTNQSNIKKIKVDIATRLCPRRIYRDKKA